MPIKKSRTETHTLFAYDIREAKNVREAIKNGDYYKIGPSFAQEHVLTKKQLGSNMFSEVYDTLIACKMECNIRLFILTDGKLTFFESRTFPCVWKKAAK